MFSAIKYRIYPNKSQELLLEKHFGCVRYVYNQALAARKESWEKEGKLLSRFEFQARLPKMKRENPWLAEVNAQSLQAAIAHNDKAFKSFFKKKSGYPRFKRKSSRQSFEVPQHGAVGDGFVKIPKVGRLKARGHRELAGKVKSITVSREPSGKYFASVLIENEEVAPQPLPIKKETMLGIDLGLKDFAILSDGRKIAHPKNLKRKLKKIKFLQRKVSRSKVGSKRREKRRQRLAIQYERVANARKDFLHKLSAELVRENQAESFALEDLSVSNMLKENRLAQAISDSGWRTFRVFLTYKAERAGKRVLTADRYAPTSKLCSCGSKNEGLELRHRKWKCLACGAVHDRDVLAAQNVKRFALSKHFSERSSEEIASERCSETTPTTLCSESSSKQNSSEPLCSGTLCSEENSSKPLCFEGRAGYAQTQARGAGR